MHFTEMELALRSKEEENVEGISHILAMFRDQGVLPVDGIIAFEDRETAMENSRKFKEIFVGLAQDETETQLFSNLWPY
ncbi:hypothetical protein BBP40_003117 [Aspergillus hancockii]|nr:hypothetical protein BBP40_003117 [Aspergillus hancockii]